MVLILIIMEILVRIISEPYVPIIITREGDDDETMPISMSGL
tara:strand:- start:369 stop:494 length:126 start_codon:yes stop_codon:yes gene_type:complete